MVLQNHAATQEDPRHTRLHSRGSTRVPPTSRGATFPPPSSRGGILSLRGRERIPGVAVASQEQALSTGKARRTPGSRHPSQSPQDVSVHSSETCFPCTASTFKPRIDSHHGGKWDSPVGKPRGKATDPLIHAKGRVTLLLQFGRKSHLCPHSRRGLTPLGRLQKYPKIHVNTGEESSGSGIHSTLDLRPRHRRERNSERPRATRMGTGLS